jgi:serine/threonine protein kinase
MAPLGKYELHEPLGKGGFGTVYRATDTVLNRAVAVKILHPQMAEDAEFLERFRREAQVVAALDHPNIVAVYDLGEIEGRIFIVMKYLPGGSLADLVRRGALPYARALEIMTQVCSGLQQVHAKGWVHRDLKPGNILFDVEGRAVVGDFGLARVLTSSTSSISAGIGTPFYRPPELWRGKPPASPATDVYSLGCILGEMLTGRILFAGDTPDEVITRHLLDGPEFGPTWPPPGCPQNAIDVMKRALERDPANRYASAGEMIKALTAAPVQPAVETGIVDTPAEETPILVELPAETPPAKPPEPEPQAPSTPPVDQAAPPRRPDQGPSNGPFLSDPDPSWKKKLLVPLLAVVFVGALVVGGIFAFSKPGSNSAPTPTAAQVVSGGAAVAGSTDAPPAGEPTPTALPLTAWQGKEITVAVNDITPPFSYFETGQLAGYNIDLMNAIASKTKFKINFVTVDINSVVLAGIGICRFDAAISNITMTDDLKKDMLLSNPYINSGQVIVVGVGANAIIRIEGFDNLKNQRLAVLTGSRGEAEARKIEGASVKTYDTADVALLGLTQGYADAVLVDSPTALKAVHDSNGKLAIVGEPITDESYAIAICKNQPELQSVINVALLELNMEGINQNLQDRWFGGHE